MTKQPVLPITSALDLKHLTPARVGLGRNGAGLPTRVLLDFSLDHARARDAVHTPFEAAAIASQLNDLSVAAHSASSRATDRKTYLKRPDLGRLLDDASQKSLAQLASAPSDIVIVIGDGLSPAAVHAHALAMVGKLIERLFKTNLAIGPVIVATGARVALGDEIGAALKARMIVMLIGERPGLSAPDSLGCYMTYEPRPGRTDADRNCISNIHAAGLSYDDAATKIAWLVREAFTQKITGIALKDDSRNQPRLIHP